MPGSHSPDTTVDDRTLPDALMELEDAIEGLHSTKERAGVCANEARVQLQELTGETVGEEDATAPAPAPENADPPTDIVAKVFALRRKLRGLQDEIEGTLEVTQGRQEAISRALGVE